MKNTILKLIALCLSILILNAPSFADQLELQTPSKVQVDYQPFSGLPASTNLRINVVVDNKAESQETVNNNKREQRFRIRFTPSQGCLLYTSPSPRDKRQSRMPSSA